MNESGIGRRSVLAAAVVAGAGLLWWKIDIPPHPVSDERDDSLQTKAIERHKALLGAALAAGINETELGFLRTQGAHLGATRAEMKAVRATTAPTSGMSTAFTKAADQHATAARAAHARDFVLVLASTSASLRQLAEAHR